MSDKGKSKKRGRLFWLTAVAAALAIHAVGLLLFQVDDETTQEAEVDYSFVTMPSPFLNESGGELLREQASLFDSAPLFLPTGWNAASSPAVNALEQRPAELFDSFPAQLSYGETDFGLGAIVNLKTRSPLQTLERFSDRSHNVFGRAEVDHPKLSRRFALLEVVDSSGGKLVLSSPVPMEGAPDEGGQLWEPAEFLVQVEAVGVLGDPVLLRGSGLEEVDQYLRDSLRRLMRERMLATGYYRVLAGP